MATAWFLKSFDDEFGPISFSELVELVRNGTVVEDDLVRPADGNLFQPAQSIIGLFYMARRAPEKTTSAPDVEQIQSVESEADSAPSAGPAADTRPEWLVRLLEARSGQLAGFDTPVPGRTAASDSILEDDSPSVLDPDDPVPDESADLVDMASSAGNFDSAESRSWGYVSSGAMSRSSSLWSSSVEQALEAVDRRGQSHMPVRGRGWLGALLYSPFYAYSRIVENLASGHRLIGLAYRALAGVVFANLTAYWIMCWSTQEALRFPSSTGNSPRPFPFIGPCTDEEYLFWLFDAAIGAGFGAYWLASVLVAKADVS